MKRSNEFPKHFDDLVNVKLRARRASIKYKHADGGAELIEKSILDFLKEWVPPTLGTQPTLRN